MQVSKRQTGEFAFKDTPKPMGVATYRTAKELPPEYRGILPDAALLKEMLGGDPQTPDKE